MRYVTPKIFPIASTQVNYGQVNLMLKELGIDNPSDYIARHRADANDDHAFLTEMLGRLCYKSFEVGLNANVTKIREGNREYVSNVLSQRHGSIFEHSTVTIALIGVSRILTHEEVRHRAGTAFSQESLRFVRLDNIRFYMPNAILNHPDERVRTEAVALIEDTVGTSERAYAKLCQLFEIDNPDKKFHDKKQLTSAFRRIAVEGLCTDLAVTANHRAWRHMISVRTAAGAEEEIREVFHLVADYMRIMHPNIYQDMYSAPVEGSDFPAYKFDNDKI